MTLASGAGIMAMAIACSGNIDNTDGPGDNTDDVTYEDLDVKYYKQLLVTEFTAVSCINCPTMAALLDEVDSKQSGEYAITALHIPYGGTKDEFCINMGQTYAERLNATGLPTGFLDLRKECEFTSDKTSFDKAVKKELSEHPAMCGVAIESDYDASGRSLSVTAKVTSNTHRKYRYLIMLIENDVKGYNYSVRSVLAISIYGNNLNNGAALVPGTEYTGTRTVTLDSGWNEANMKIVVSALISEDPVGYEVTWLCDNAAMCGIGGKADYKYINE